MKNNYCYEGYDFQEKTKSILKGLRECQDTIQEFSIKIETAKKDMEKRKQELKEIGFKGDCNKCIHKLECTTHGEQLKIQKENHDGW